MPSNQQEWINVLEAIWEEPSGFLYTVRQGKFDPAEGEKFISQLTSITSSNFDLLEKRLVSLVWYIPLFLDWQIPRIAKEGGDVDGYKKMSNRAHSLVEAFLGVP